MTFQNITSSSITSDSSTDSLPSTFSLSTPQVRYSYSTRKVVNRIFSFYFLLLRIFSLFVPPIFSLILLLDYPRIQVFYPPLYSSCTFANLILSPLNVYYTQLLIFWSTKEKSNSEIYFSS